MLHPKTPKLFFIIFIAVLLAACNRKPEADFSEVILKRWYSGEIKNEKLFMRFTAASEKSAEGIAFYDEGKGVVTPGKVSIGENYLKVQYNGTTRSHNGRWNISPQELVFVRKSDGKEKSVFRLLPDYSTPTLKQRYMVNMFDTVSRTEVKYGSAKGFYTSKKVADMNAGSYPQIVVEVLNELKNNLFTEQLPLQMDIYQPKGDTLRERPLLLLIHGGAFIVGDKRDSFQKKLAIHYAKLGYVVASINYRLGYLFIPGAYSNLERCIYRAVQDSRAAIRWLVKNKKKYGIDPDRIFVAGNSAGGFIALKTAFMAESETYQSVEGNLLMIQEDLGCLDCSGNSIKEKFRLRGVISMWGALTDIEMMDEFEKVPLLLIHGDSDKIVPYRYDYPFRNVGEEYASFFVQKVYGSDTIYSKAVSMGFPATLVSIPGGSHEPQVDDNNAYTPELKTILTAIDSFLYTQMIPDSIKIEKTADNAFHLSHGNEAEQVYWQISGGCITAVPERGKVKIVRFSNEPVCVLHATAVSKNGIAVQAELKIE